MGLFLNVLFKFLCAWITYRVTLYLLNTYDPKMVVAFYMAWTALWHSKLTFKQ